jgi:hypothetical protein
MKGLCDESNVFWILVFRTLHMIFTSWGILQRHHPGTLYNIIYNIILDLLQIIRLF